MNIDILARESAADLHHAVDRSIDPGRTYAELGRLRARRRRERVLAAAGAVAAVVALVTLPRPGGADSLPAVPPVPATPRLTSSVVAVTERGLVTAGPRPEPASLPVLAAGQRPQSLAFSPDAKHLAYAVAGSLHVRDLRDGSDRVVAPCSARCPVAWAPDGATLVTSRDGTTLTVMGVDGAVQRSIRLPANWGVTGGMDVSPEGRIVMAGNLGWQGAVLAVGLDGLDPYVVIDLSGHTTVADARWSADAKRVLFLVHANGESAADEADLSLRSVRTDGADGRVEAEVGLCLCTAQKPGLDVSPSGEVVLGALLDSTRGAHVPTLVLWSGGRLWSQEAQASAPVAFLPR